MMITRRLTLLLAHGCATLGAVDIRDELTAARGRKETARADLVVLVQRAALVDGLSAYQIREATGLNRRTIAAMLEPAQP